MEHIHIPKDVKILLYVAVASGLVLFFYFYFWIGIAGAISLTFFTIFTKKKSKTDSKIVARVFRQRDDKLQGYVLPIREEVAPKDYDIVAKIESQNLRHVLGVGQSGSGKSQLLKNLLWTYTDFNEMRRYGIEPCIAYVFNVKPHPKGHGDFENLGFKYYDLLDNLPDVFNKEYRAELVTTFATIFTERLTSVGIMADTMTSCFDNILAYKSCKNFKDVIANAQQLAQTSTGLEQQLYGLIALRMKELDVGKQNEVNFSWDASIILDTSYLPTPLCQNFFIEMYSRIITKKAMQEHRLGRNHRILLCVDEASRILSYGKSSILSLILRQGRASMRLFLGTQSATDILQGDEHFQWFQFRTSNSIDIQKIQTLAPLHAEAVRLLHEHEFVWVNDGQSQTIPIFKLDVTRLQEFEETHPQIYPSEEVESKNEIVKDKLEVEIVESTKYDKEKTARKILDVVETNPTGLFVSQVLEKIGYGDRKDSNRGTAFRLIKKMAKDGKIRIKDYISADKRGHKLVFSKNNPHRAETQVHKEQKKDTKTLLDENKVSYTEGEINQGWDFETENAVIEVESGLKNSLKEWNDKVMASEKLVITILCNEEDRERYSYLSCVEADKTKLVLLYELLETLGNLQK